MFDSFHATIKMITGEEVLARVLPTDENQNEIFILNNPIIIQEETQVNPEKGVAISGLIPKKWLMFANDETTIVNKTHVVSMSELDKFGVDFYQKALIAAKAASPIKKRVESKNNSGYLGLIDKFRKDIEDIFNNSHDLPNT
jgi:hypothetical protein